MDEILPNLFVSDLDTAQNDALLAANNIQSVISVMTEPVSFLAFPRVRHHKIVPIEDDDGT